MTGGPTSIKKLFVKVSMPEYVPNLFGVCKEVKLYTDVLTYIYKHEFTHRGCDQMGTFGSLWSQYKVD